MESAYNISVFTENSVGMLNRITIIFTRRHINIESITASESKIDGIHRYTIVVKEPKDFYENKKSGTLSQNEMDSALVDLSILISNCFSKYFRVFLTNDNLYIFYKYFFDKIIMH